MPGASACGCDMQRGVCPIVPSAEANAKKSGGLHWTVLMMHPQTSFPGNVTYVQWLDGLVAQAAQLEQWDVRFVNFQDLVALKAPTAPPTPTPAPVVPTPAPSPPPAGCSVTYDQCGGTGWSGPGKCCSTTDDCVPDGSGYYSQCLPKTGQHSR